MKPLKNLLHNNIRLPHVALLPHVDINNSSHPAILLLYGPTEILRYIHNNLFRLVYHFPIILNVHVAIRIFESANHLTRLNFRYQTKIAVQPQIQLEGHSYLYSISSHKF